MDAEKSTYGLSNFTALKTDMQRQLKEVMLKTSNSVASEAKSLCPRDTGALRQSIYVSQIGGHESVWLNGTFVPGPKQAYEYARFLKTQAISVGRTPKGRRVSKQYRFVDHFITDIPTDDSFFVVAGMDYGSVVELNHPYMTPAIQHHAAQYQADMGVVVTRLLSKYKRWAARLEKSGKQYQVK